MFVVVGQRAVKISRKGVVEAGPWSSGAALLDLREARVRHAQSVSPAKPQRYDTAPPQGSG